MRSMLSRETLRSQRSTEPIYVRCNPESSASISWESPASTRRRLIRVANLCLADLSCELPDLIGAKVRAYDDFASTDYE